MPKKDNTSLYLEGNGGGDYIELLARPDGLLELKVGHCCVATPRMVVPVELLTSLLMAAYLEGEEYRQAFDPQWPEEFREQLAAQVRRLR